MNGDIHVIEKPDWVSWDDIHEVLVQAHALNRSKGINMRKPSLPGEEIKKEIGDDGVMLVAIDGDKVIGTAALVPKTCSTWFYKGQYGYLCYASVLPEYLGNGVYRMFCEEREKVARKKGFNALYIDTHHDNEHVIKINLKNGFKRVGVRVFSDHWNVVLFKWLDGCPYSDFRCDLMYVKTKIEIKTKWFIKKMITPHK